MATFRSHARRLSAPEPCRCDGGWIDIHDEVGDESDLRDEHELIGQRIHVRCSDCNDEGKK
jgi:hypothetical protein